MSAKRCSGIDVFTGSPVQVAFDGTIDSVAPASDAGDLYVAPGWIDIQVNGFAGVDYNNPSTPADEISRSVEVLLSAGVTRFYPTVITGSPEDMYESLRNVARAAGQIPHGEVIE